MIEKKIIVVVGTRPNFIKITQLEKEFEKFNGRFNYILVHTGQHFDKKMSSVFFEQLKLKHPDFNLEVQATTREEKMVKMQDRLHQLFSTEKPDLVMVVGDVDSTYSAAKAAKALDIKIAHLESGLRSFDNGMPEEVNRIAVDAISDLYFITEKSGQEHLGNEGYDKSTMHFVGNTMIDTLVAFDSEIQSDQTLDRLNILKQEYALVTMHRPANVDFEEPLRKILTLLNRVSNTLKVVIPIHPRTKQKIKDFGLSSLIDSNPNIIELEPIDYFAFQNLILNAKVIITDSGGIQEETTFRRIPCLTVRPNTERPSTIELGTNELLPLDVNQILEKIEIIHSGNWKNGEIPPLWDGKATQRIVSILNDVL